jgi:hypothetical protein
MDPRRREQLFRQLRKQFAASQIPTKPKAANTTSAPSPLSASSNIPNTSTMASKRRVIDLDGDDDSDVVEIIPAPSTGARPHKAPRVTNPTPGLNKPTKAPNAPRSVPDVANPASPQQFFTTGVGITTSLIPFFPDRTLATIAELRRREIQTVMQAYESNHPITQQYIYTIQSDSAVDSAKDFSTHTVGPSTPSLSFANARLLHQFLARNPRMAAMKERPKFILLPSMKGVKNPRFAHLHAVRYDEVGCGFDEDNCLSLLLTELVDGERHTKVLYVERIEAEVEVEKKVEMPTATEIKDEGRD